MEKDTRSASLWVGLSGGGGGGGGWGTDSTFSTLYRIHTDNTMSTYHMQNTASS